MKGAPPSHHRLKDTVHNKLDVSGSWPCRTKQGLCACVTVCPPASMRGLCPRPREGTAEELHAQEGKLECDQREGPLPHTGPRGLGQGHGMRAPRSVQV